MLHHINGAQECPLCEDKLKSVHPDLASWYRKRVKPCYPLIHISWGYRDKENQEICVTSGKSKLHYPMSPHNKKDAQGNPCSLAIDLFEQIGAKNTWPMNVFHGIQELVDMYEDPIKWGGRWGWDSDHFELTT